MGGDSNGQGEAEGTQRQAVGEVKGRLELAQRQITTCKSRCIIAQRQDTGSMGQMEQRAQDTSITGTEYKQHRAQGTGHREKAVQIIGHKQHRAQAA